MKRLWKKLKIVCKLLQAKEYVVLVANKNRTVDGRVYCTTSRLRVLNKYITEIIDREKDEIEIDPESAVDEAQRIINNH